MNPIVLLGLGAIAIIASGKKRSAKSERSYSATKAIPTKTISNSQFIDPIKLDLPQIAPPKTPYKMLISVNGPKIAKFCHKKQGLNTIEDVARCIASDLFPASGWPATNVSEAWERNAWHQIINITRAEFGLNPIAQKATAQSVKIG